MLWKEQCLSALGGTNYFLERHFKERINTTRDMRIKKGGIERKENAKIMQRKIKTKKVMKKNIEG